MENLKKSQSLIISAVITLFLLTLVCLVYKYYISTEVENIYNFSSTNNNFIQSLLNEFLNIKPFKKSLEEYLLKTRIYLTRLSLIIIFFEIIYIFSIYKNKIINLLNGFFKSEAYPVNLAVFRIALFYTIFHYFYVDKIVNFTRLPKELIFPPVGYGSFVHLIPLNTELVTILSYLFLIFCFTSMIGLFTRISIISTLILGIYLLGIPNLFGKVNHGFHHLIWFTAILSVSRCSDAISVDKVISSLLNSRSNLLTEKTQPSIIYSLPIRFIWLLFGIIYFFPGFWKIWYKGVDWIISDNLKYQMYDKWFSHAGWTPFFRIDQYPYLYKLSAIGTILFEISFIFLIFLPGIRYFSIFGGIAFHNFTNLFMRISFKQLQYCYIVFFNWDNIFKTIGKFIFRDKIFILFNKNNIPNIRFLSFLSSLDVLGRTEYIDFSNIKTDLRLSSFGDIDQLSDSNDLIVLSNNSSFTKKYAICKILSRIPLSWIFIPLMPLYFLLSKLPHDLKSGLKQKKYSLKPLIVVASFLIIINTIFGFTYTLSSWPFSSYPSFRRLKTEPKSELLTIEIEDINGEINKLDIRSLKKYYGTARLKHVLKLVNKSGDPSKLFAVWNIFKRENPELVNVKYVYFYKETYSTIPSDNGYQLLDREILYELKQ